jgi:DNA-directed RNA polymerase subunit RPC12/RpoP
MKTFKNFINEEQEWNSQKEILDEIKRLYVDCPDCSSMGDDDQYTCTTCWNQGGNGRINVYEYLKNHKDLL